MAYHGSSGPPEQNARGNSPPKHMKDRSIIPVPLTVDLVLFCEAQGKALGGTRVSYIRGLLLAAKAAAESQARNLPVMDDRDAAERSAGIVSIQQLRKARKGAAK